MSENKETTRKPALTAMLPSASVHFFSSEEHTQDLAATLSGDWRFGRVSLEHKGDSIDDAIAHYMDYDSPTVIVLQTNDANDDFQKNLAKLAEYCSEGTNALVIGPVNDVQLYRKLTSIGVSDYLVHPVSIYDMAEALSRTLLSMLGASNSRLMAVIGSKGGVGTSNVAHIAASVCSGPLAQKTMLLDAAAGRSTLWAQFGLNPTGTLVEAAKAAVDRDHDTMSRILMAVDENLTFLNTGAEPILGNASQDKLFEMLLDRMLGQYPVVTADLSTAPTGVQNSVLARAHGVLVVTTPTVSALSLTRTLIKEIQDLRGNDADSISLIINRSGEAPAFEVPAKDIAEAVGVEIAHNIPYAPKHFMKYESEGARPSGGPEGEKLISALTPLIGDLMDLHASTNSKASDGTENGLWPGLLKKFTS